MSRVKRTASSVVIYSLTNLSIGEIISSAPGTVKEALKNSESSDEVKKEALAKAQAMAENMLQEDNKMCIRDRCCLWCSDR